MDITLIGSRVAVKLDPKEGKSKGGILLPEQSQTETSEGVVVAVGPGAWSSEKWRFEPMEVAPGQRVIVEKFRGSEVTIDGEDLWIVDARNVVLIKWRHPGEMKAHATSELNQFREAP